MKVKLIPLIALPIAAGCLSSAPEAPSRWTMEWLRAEAETTARGDAAVPAAKTVRIASVDVRPPYSGMNIAVLRPDGTVAFDPFNSFAASPAQILRGITLDAVEASGRFARVITSGSSAAAGESLEACVTMLALDCRNEGRPAARVALTLTLLRSRDIVSMVKAEASIDAGCDYSAAFSKAYARAAAEAVAKLKF